MATGLSNREVGFLIGGLTAGIGIGYFGAVKQYELKMEALIAEHTEELLETQAAYNRAKENWEKPKLEDVITDLGYTPAEEAAIQEANVVEDTEGEQRNIFKTPPVDVLNWDYEVEGSKRSTLAQGTPYIIHREEFFENAPEHTQSTITYYAGDDVLADERDEVLEPRDHIVGSSNLHMLGTGHGSGDPNVIYIRNPRTSMDFEIINNPGKFAEEALGFLEHSFEPTPRRLRFDDE